MSKRRLGLVMVLTFAAAIAAATIFQDFRFDASAARAQAAYDQRTRTLQAIQIALADFRGAQAAYVANGQGYAFWLKRAGELTAQMETGLNDLLKASSDDVRARYESALWALGVLNSLDQKVRDDLHLGETSLASDVIFSDATSASERLGTELAAAQWAEAAARDAGLIGLRRQRLAMNGGGVAAVFVLLLVAALRRPRVAAHPASGDAAAVPAGADVERVVAPAPPAVVAPAAADAPPLSPRSSLSDAAQVCVDLARVLDGQDVPPLLERAARVLDARGLVLWVADARGALLRPSLAHGYPERVVQRLGPLPASADNVTSLAFRSMQPQTLPGQGKSGSSAIAVPLISPTGCIGVLAAEIGHDASASDALALARIFAAQLATVVTPAAGGQQAAQA